ncbi:MAG: hypothetical protein M5U26_13370 [Planctomycetota bacterium]|nr:hypothetical protein [Planctomycetota bacterium]
MRATAILAGLAALLLWGCSGSQKPGEEVSGGAERGGKKTPQDFVQIDKETTPQERKYLEVGRKFIVAVAAGEHASAYVMLSSHARARMSLNQFLAPENDKEAKLNEKNALKDVSAESFAELMGKVVAQYGPPVKPIDLHVQETDPQILAGKADGLEALSVMFAIGMMPKDIPAGIRRASLRGQVRCRFKPEDLKQAAEEMGMTPEEVEQDEELAPYYTLKQVLVEEGGELKIGYFEFLPPSMAD